MPSPRRRPMAAVRARGHTCAMNAPKTVPSFDPTMPRFTTASAEDIRRAEELRRQIEQRYLAPPPREHDRYWSVGAD
jgi:hypothetical protein